MRYFLITYIRKPSGQMDEMTSVSKSLRKKDLQMANVILDFKDMKVLAASLQGTVIPKNWESVHNFYYQHYKATFDRLHAENGRKVLIEDEDKSTINQSVDISEDTN